MRTRFGTHLPIAMATALVASLALAGAVLGHQATLTAALAGGADTDTDGTGTATVMLDSDAGTACWDITVEDIPAATQSHIHVGAAGVNGGVVVPFDVDGFDGSTEGCVEDQDNAVLQAIIDNPAGYYVNIHTGEFPGGAIRGQLRGTVPSTAVSGPAGTSPLLLIGLALLGLSAVMGVRTWRSLPLRD